MTHAPPLSDLSQLSGAEKEALIVALWTRLDAALAANAELMAKLEALTGRVAALEAKLNEPAKPAKTPDNSSLPASHGHKATRPTSRLAANRGRAAAPASGGRCIPTPTTSSRPGPRPVLPARRPSRRAIRSCKPSLSGSNCRRSSPSLPRSAFTAAPARIAGRRSRRRRRVWSPARPSAPRSRPWRSTCTIAGPSVSSGCPPCSGTSSGCPSAKGRWQICSKG